MTSYRSIKRLKVLLPTLRERKRYILVKIICDKDLSYEEIERGFWDAILKSFGRLAFLTGFKILKDTFDKNKKTLIIKCNHLSKYFVVFALGNIEEINGKKCIIKFLKISGTIKRVKKLLLKNVHKD